MLAFAPRLAVRSLPRAVPALRVAPAARRTLLTSAVRRGVSTRYTAEHEWVRFDDASNVGTIGITDYAQNSLGDVVFVELPAEGSQVKMGGECGAESDGAAYWRRGRAVAGAAGAG
jgi:glycine cleavage system H protein